MHCTGRCYLSQKKVQSEDFVVQVIYLNAHGYIKFIPLNAMRQMHEHTSTTTYRKRRPDFTALKKEENFCVIYLAGIVADILYSSSISINCVHQVTFYRKTLRKKILLTSERMRQ